MTREPTLATDCASGALSKDTPEEFERLRLLPEWGDPDTRTVLGTAGIGRDRRCLTIGAGAGAVARWVAEQCPNGSVVAVDIDTRYLADELPNLEGRTRGIREHFAPASSTWPIPG